MDFGSAILSLQVLIMILNQNEQFWIVGNRPSLAILSVLALDAYTVLGQYFGYIFIGCDWECC